MERFLQEKKREKWNFRGKYTDLQPSQVKGRKSRSLQSGFWQCSPRSGNASVPPPPAIAFLLLIIIILVLRNWLVFYSENRMNVEKDIYIEKLGLTWRQSQRSPSWFLPLFDNSCFFPYLDFFFSSGKVLIIR